MKKILVIDDEEWLREMVHMALRQRGYEVIEAPDGASGIEKARAELPDLILCDVNMDKVDGYLTLSSLRDQTGTATIPFILMTGLADNAGMRHGMELGADDYLAKPFSIDALYAAVEARLKKVQTVRQEAERKLSDLRVNISLALPHELRTPLTGILAYGEIFMQDAATLKPEEITEMGQVILDSGKRLERVIENFVAYTQLELLAADPTHAHSLRGAQTANAAAVIEQTVRKLAASSNREADLQLRLNAAAFPMSEEHLAKVVTELADNAFKFSKPGTPVQVELRDEGDSVSLSVSDCGRGFTPEQRANIGAYMQFDRKKQEQQGLGLGLAIVRRLSELHGGSPAIQSDPGQGSRVVIRLPKAIAA